MRFFFDVTTEKQSLLDYRGHEFHTARGAIEFANSMVQRLEYSLNENWAGWSIEVRNEHGNRLYAFPVGRNLQAA